jgi:hypothetical protein
MTPSEAKIFMQNAYASCFRNPKLTACELARNKWSFLDKGAQGFREIALWWSTRHWVVFERDSPISETLAPFLHRRKKEGFMAMDGLQFGSGALCRQLLEGQESRDRAVLLAKRGPSSTIF